MARDVRDHSRVAVAVRALLQRVTRAAVRVDGATVGAIDRGLVVLVGVGPDDVRRDEDRELCARLVGAGAPEKRSDQRQVLQEWNTAIADLDGVADQTANNDGLAIADNGARRRFTCRDDRGVQRRLNGLRR